MRNWTYQVRSALATDLAVALVPSSAPSLTAPLIQPVPNLLGSSVGRLNLQQLAAESVNRHRIAALIFDKHLLTTAQRFFKGATNDEPPLCRR